MGGEIWPLIQLEINNKFTLPVSHFLRIQNTFNHLLFFLFIPMYVRPLSNHPRVDFLHKYIYGTHMSGVWELVYITPVVKVRCCAAGWDAVPITSVVFCCWCVGARGEKEFVLVNFKGNVMLPTRTLELHLKKLERKPSETSKKRDKDSKLLQEK